MCLLALTAMITSCRNQEPISPLLLPSTSVIETSEVWAVVTADSLRLRAQPTLRAKILSNLYRGEVVEIFKRSEEKENIDGKTDFWFEVTIEGVNGWVFGSHLELVGPADRPNRENHDSTHIIETQRD